MISPASRDSAHAAVVGVERDLAGDVLDRDRSVAARGRELALARQRRRAACALGLKCTPIWMPSNPSRRAGPGHLDDDAVALLLGRDLHLVDQRLFHRAPLDLDLDLVCDPRNALRWPRRTCRAATSGTPATVNVFVSRETMPSELRLTSQAASDSAPTRTRARVRRRRRVLNDHGLQLCAPGVGVEGMAAASGASLPRRNSMRRRPGGRPGSPRQAGRPDKSTWTRSWRPGRRGRRLRPRRSARCRAGPSARPASSRTSARPPRATRRRARTSVRNAPSIVSTLPASVPSSSSAVRSVTTIGRPPSVARDPDRQPGAGGAVGDRHDAVRAFRANRQRDQRGMDVKAVADHLGPDAVGLQHRAGHARRAMRHRRHAVEQVRRMA